VGGVRHGEVDPVLLYDSHNFALLFELRGRGSDWLLFGENER
jgi:hypothetical protein